MGIFDSKETRIEKAKKEALTFMLPGENVDEVFLLIEDFIAITENRVIFVDKKIASTKKQITSIPFSKITAVSISRGGFMSFSKELEIAVGDVRYDITVYTDTEAMNIYRKLTSKLR